MPVQLEKCGGLTNRPKVQETLFGRTTSGYRHCFRLYERLHQYSYIPPLARFTVSSETGGLQAGRAEAHL